MTRLECPVCGDYYYTASPEVLRYCAKNHPLHIPENIVQKFTTTELKESPKMEPSTREKTIQKLQKLQKLFESEAKGLNNVSS